MSRRLETFDDVLHVSDLIIPAGVTLVTEPSEPIARVQPPRVEEEPTVVSAEEELAAEAAEAGEAGEAAPGAAAESHWQRGRFRGLTLAPRRSHLAAFSSLSVQLLRPLHVARSVNRRMVLGTERA